MVKPVQVVVLICCYNGKQYLDDCLGSLLANEEPGIDRRIVLVDDASSDGSADFARRRFPTVDVVRLDVNVGFAAANNAGHRYTHQQYPGAQYLVLLNMDTKVTPGWLRPLLDHLGSNPQVAAAQPKIMLHPEMDLINTIGDRSHYLGFGFMLGYREVDRGQYSSPFSIDFASGAAMILRTHILEQVGLFDETFHMYLEDAELCWKIRQIGYEIVTVPQSVVYHKYSSKAPLTHYYYLERNRWLLLLTYYKLPTLLLLAPALLLMEFGQMAYAGWTGGLRKKVRSYAYFWKAPHIRALWRKRAGTQRRRVIGDRHFMTRFAGSARFEAIDNLLLRYVGNPILGAYWCIARRLIFW